MSVLTITTAEVKRFCSIASADTSQDTPIGALITDLQAALEYGIDPAALATTDTGAIALLTLAVTEIIAGSFLEQLARSPGYTDDIRIGPLYMTSSRGDSLPQLGDRLRAVGLKRLEPFQRATKRLAYDMVAGVGDGSTKLPQLADAPILASVFDGSSDTPSIFDPLFDGVIGEGG